MDYILGVDGGGTKTLAAAADTNGKILAELQFGSSNFKSSGFERAKSTYTKGILSIIRKLKKSFSDQNPFFKSACIGLAGLNTAYDRKMFNELILNDDLKPVMDTGSALLVNDTVIGLAAGSMKENRVIIIAGTGSNCYGENAEGMHAKANGWDHILGDEGSGFSMGIHTLRAVMRAYDGRGPKTLLTKNVFDYLRLKDIDELNMWTYDTEFSKDRFASLSLVLCNTAEMGDRVAIKILKKEALEVIINIKTVVKKLKLENEDFDLVFVGNNFKCKEYFTDIIMEKLKKDFPFINFLPLTNRPVEGAVRLAVKNIKQSERFKK
ncbi:MAG: BadF/BadG/BcrA/BcrD ATPase family protein [Actinomycetota bacterium]|nr:BadF/BadG/BcrA/BcrD ATPase family protein [Actinomycetota bacterium]